MPLPLILAFLTRIGLPHTLAPLPDDTFLPGIAIRQGVLTIDEAKLLYPGDLLHEAGHLAVMHPSARLLCNGDAGPDPAAEMAAIAWSYAAALAIGLDPAIVFHPHGYRSGGQAILENFTQGRYFGVPLLQLYGLTRESTWRDTDELKTQPAYPQMNRWLRE